MKKITPIFLFIVIFLLGASYWFLSLPVDPSNTQEQVFLINPGDGLSTIGRRLESQHLVRSRYVFMLQVKLSGLEKKIQAGDFKLSANLSTSQIANQLTFGTLDTWVRILEGWRSEEIAQTLKDTMPNYEISWNQQLKAKEGYLFPDTYLIPKQATIADIISILTTNFDKKVATIPNKGKNGLTTADTVILASIVERETPKNSDRPLVAGVLLNRIKMGMPIQSDVTIQYILGYQPQEKSWWKKVVLSEDTQIPSPFNTYLHVGLPPAPICNPGLSSLTASFNPQQTDYLYYLSDQDGNMHYAKTYEQHQANIAKYL